MAYNGTIIGSPVFGAAKFGNGLTGLSDSNYLLLPISAWPTVPALTVEAWLKISGNQISVAVSTDGWMGMYSSGNFAAAMCGTFVDSGIPINDNTWHHCAFVVTGGLLKTYVDGVPGASAPITYAAPLLPPMIGRYAAVVGFSWAGSIDEVAIWYYAKYSSAYTVPTAAYTGAEQYLMALYHLDVNGSDSTGIYAANPNVIDPTNAAIIYSPFNWNVTAGYARTINSGAYFRTIFSGTSLTINTDTTPNAYPFSQLWVRIDNQSWVQYSLSANSPALPVASNLANGKHSIEVLVKATTAQLQRWSPSQTVVQITGLMLDPGASLTSPIRRSKNVLIFGDSITEGVNAINTPDTLDVNREDALGCYSYALATAIDAEVGVVGFGGAGVNTYGAAGVPPLSQSYAWIMAGIARSFSSPAPNLVIYNIGTNDQGSITAGLVTIVQAILQAAPKSLHLLLNPFNGTHTADLYSAVGTLNNPNVLYQSTTGWFDPINSVDGIHPYNYAHVELIAPRLYQVVLAFLGSASVVSSAQYAFR